MSGGKRDNNAKELLTCEIRPLFSPGNFLRSPEYTTKKEGKNGAFSEGKRTFNKLVGRQVKAIDRLIEHRKTHKACFLHSPYFCLLFCFHINLKRKVIWRLKVQWESENELCRIIWQVWKFWNCTQIKSRIIAFLSDTNTKADLTRRHTSWLIIYLHKVFS